jgi:hypothetical protein
MALNSVGNVERADDAHELVDARNFEGITAKFATKRDGGAALVRTSSYCSISCEAPNELLMI